MNAWACVPSTHGLLRRVSEEPKSAHGALEQHGDADEAAGNAHCCESEEVVPRFDDDCIDVSDGTSCDIHSSCVPAPRTVVRECEEHT